MHIGSSKEIYKKCKELISDRLVDGEIKPKSKTVIKMTSKEWLEEIIYHYGNMNEITNPLLLCCDLFILLDKLDDIDKVKRSMLDELEPNEQIKWERDIAIQQLNELGYEFGEKIGSDEDKTVKELRTECEGYLDTDLSPEKRCKTIKEMTPKEWLEEIIYSYGNGSAKPHRLYFCSDLFILLDKLETKAKWEFIKSKNKPSSLKISKWWKCSKCGTISEHPTKYCCWCGSRMEKEDE